jgi:hypothetical protein
MSRPIEPSKTPFPKPIKIKVADVFLIVVRENHIQVTDLSERNAHYSAWFYGSTFDFHKTIEPHSVFPKRQIPILKKELNLPLLTERIAQDLCDNRNPLARITRTNSPEWKDLEFQFIPITELKELFSNVVKGNRWTFGMDFFDNFESAFRYAKLRELSESSPVMGWSSEGFFTLSYGKNCVLVNTNKVSESFEKNLQLSPRP